MIGNVDVEAYSANIEGQYIYDYTVDDFFVIYGLGSDLVDADSVKMNVDGKNLSAYIDNLQKNTLYYFCIECRSSISSKRSDISSFTTENILVNHNIDGRIKPKNVISTFPKTSCGSNLTIYKFKAYIPYKQKFKMITKIITGSEAKNLSYPFFIGHSSFEFIYRKVRTIRCACRSCSTAGALLIHRSSRSPFPAGER